MANAGVSSGAAVGGRAGGGGGAKFSVGGGIESRSSFGSSINKAPSFGPKTSSGIQRFSTMGSARADVSRPASFSRLGEFNPAKHQSGPKLKAPVIEFGLKPKGGDAAPRTIQRANSRDLVRFDQLQRITARPNATVQELHKLSAAIPSPRPIDIPGRQPLRPGRVERLTQPRVEPLAQTRPVLRSARPIEMRPLTQPRPVPMVEVRSNPLPQRLPETAPVREQPRSTVETRPRVIETVPTPVQAQVAAIRQELQPAVAQPVKKEKVVAPVVRPVQKNERPNHKEARFYQAMQVKREAQRAALKVVAEPKAPSQPEVKVQNQAGVTYVNSSAEAVVLREQEEKKKKKKFAWKFGESWRMFKTKLIEKTKSKIKVKQMLATKQTQKLEATTNVQTQTKVLQQAAIEAVEQVKEETKAKVQVQPAAQVAVNVDSPTNIRISVPLPPEQVTAEEKEEKEEEKYAIDKQTQARRADIAKRGIWLSFAGSEEERVEAEKITQNFAAPSVDTTSGLLLEAGLADAIEKQRMVDPTDKLWRDEFASKGLVTAKEAEDIVVFIQEQHRPVLKGEGKRASQDEVEKVQGRKKDNYALAG